MGDLGGLLRILGSVPLVLSPTTWRPASPGTLLLGLRLHKRLRVEGHDTTKAEELVRAFRRTLETLQEDRQRILKSIAFD